MIVRRGKPFKAFTSFYLGGGAHGRFPAIEWEAVGEEQDRAFIMLLSHYLEGKWRSGSILSKHLQETEGTSEPSVEA